MCRFYLDSVLGAQPLVLIACVVQLIKLIPPIYRLTYLPTYKYLHDHPVPTDFRGRDYCVALAIIRYERTPHNEKKVIM